MRTGGSFIARSALRHLASWHVYRDCPTRPTSPTKVRGKSPLSADPPHSNWNAGYFAGSEGSLTPPVYSILWQLSGEGESRSNRISEKPKFRQPVSGKPHRNSPTDTGTCRSYVDIPCSRSKGCLVIRNDAENPVFPHAVS